MMFAKIGSKEILKSDDYIFEPKLDGYRALCTKINNTIIITSRNNFDITSNYTELDFNLKKNCVIDGELIIYDAQGNPSFSLMQKRSGNASFVVFDILEVDGVSVKKLSLFERKKLLNDVVVETKNVKIVPMSDDGKKLWNVIKSRHLEGVIAKKKNSTYVDSRSSNWLKIKNELTIDCVVVGYVSKVREIASLALALFDETKLIYIGQVGTGFNEYLLKELIQRLVVVKNNNVSLPKNVVPVFPELVCEIKYLMFTDDKKLRAPVFLKIREDKEIHECTFNQIQ